MALSCPRYRMKQNHLTPSNETQINTKNNVSYATFILIQTHTVLPVITMFAAQLNTMHCNSFANFPQINTTYLQFVPTPQTGFQNQEHGHRIHITQLKRKKMRSQTHETQVMISEQNTDEVLNFLNDKSVTEWLPQRVRSRIYNSSRGRECGILSELLSDVKK